MCFPLFELLLVKGLESCGAFDDEFSPGEVEFLVDEFALVNEPACALVLGLGLEPVGRPRNALQLLGVLLRLVVLLVHLDPLLDHVH